MHQMNNNRYYIETYGCQMNVYDSELVENQLKKTGYRQTHDIKSANLIILNTCSIREKAEETVHNRLDSIEYLKRNKILIGSTTGFYRENMEIIKKKLEFHYLSLDSYVSSTCLNKPSRPYPYMIQENMNLLNIHNPRSVIKIDDTAVGIQEGQNANCWTVGVSRWSINMDIDSLEMIDSSID